MKKLLLLLLVTNFSTLLYSQATAYSNFKLAEQEIIYQKVFEKDSITSAKMEAYYKTLSYVTNLEAKSDGIQFDMNDITVDYKKFQFSQVNTPLIIQTGKYSGKVSISIKDGKYRITIKSIQLTGNIVYKMIAEKDNLTRYATKNSGTVLAEDWCRPNMLGLLDKAFSDKLECKTTEDEW